MGVVEADVIVETLKNADNEATSAPYWLILEPTQNMSCDVFLMAAGITGPFFSRKDAEDHLKARRYAFSSKAVVFCNSGYWSKKYKALCRDLNQV